LSLIGDGGECQNNTEKTLNKMIHFFVLWFAEYLAKVSHARIQLAKLPIIVIMTGSITDFKN
jgi:hypothetical protein